MMNDLEFEQRATTNPFDASSEFLAAVQETPERQQLVNELKAFEAELSTTLNSVNASEELKQRLLDIADSVDAITSISTPAANDKIWLKRALPVAASLMIAVVAAISFWPANSKSELELDIFAHIYRESHHLEVETILPMSEVNQTMASAIGVEFKQTPELVDLEFHVAGDCWVARENAIHMTIKGNEGPVTVMIVPSSAVEKEIKISDDRFEGLITPTPGGYMVVVGEEGEAIAEYSNMIAGNINW